MEGNTRVCKMHRDARKQSFQNKTGNTTKHQKLNKKLEKNKESKENQAKQTGNHGTTDVNVNL